VGARARLRQAAPESAWDVIACVGTDAFVRPEANRGVASTKLEESCADGRSASPSLGRTNASVATRARSTRVRYPQLVGFRYPSARDQQLIQIVDAALADTTRKSGHWLACRPGCTQCCIGVFAINQLDALRLQRGLAKLEKDDPKRTAAIRERARDSAKRLSRDFPGDLRTGSLYDDADSRGRFEDFANDEPCPVLDPETGLCELYESRPMTCRVFGPPVRSEDGLGVCELCFQGAADKEIAACEMIPDPDDLESRLVDKVEKSSGRRGETIIAFCLGS
jgi:Fe-S-cluster containining protein